MSSISSFSTFSARLREFMACSAGSDEGFGSLALELFALQFQHNPAYRRFCETRGVSPQTLRDWRQIPAVSTAAFKELELSCLPESERTAVFHSSGTTAHRPSRHFHSSESLGIYEASALAWFKAVLAGSAVGDWQLAILTPGPKQAPHSSLVRMFDAIRRELGAEETALLGTCTPAGIWTLDVSAATSALTHATGTGRPVLLLGTAFLFVYLLDHFTEQSIRLTLPRGSIALETGGYKGRSRTLPKAELHGLIHQQLGIPEARIVCEYGMSELSSQAYDCLLAEGEEGGARQSDGLSERRSGLEAGLDGPARPFRFPRWGRVQIISPETDREVGEGETGLIRVYDLANVYSVLAIQTEDLGIRRGDGFELIGRAELAEARGCSRMSV